MPKFSVIIVNYNGQHFLQKAIDSLAAQTFKDFELLIVDNASSDGSFEKLDVSSLERISLIPQTENTGFARGNNLAAKAARGEWIALLNPDAEASRNWLEQVLAGMARHPGCNMFACAQFDMARPDRLDGAGDCYLGFGIPWRGGFGRPASELPGEGLCFSPCGAAAIFRTSTYWEAGGFDEDLFCFCEDVDLGYRLQLRGERCIFLPDASVLHAGGGLSGRVSEFSLRHGARNRLWTYIKNTPGLLLLLTLPGHILLTLLILFRGTMTGRFLPTLKGVRDGVTGLGPVWRKRREVQKTRTASLMELSRAMSWNLLTMLQRKPHVRSFRDKQETARESSVYKS